MDQQVPFWGTQPPQNPTWGSPTSTTSDMRSNPFAMAQKKPQLSTIPGRIINDPNEIMPIDVPMDGRPAFFPKSDFSCIYGRMWTQDGKIAPVTFVPYVEPAGAESKDEDQNGGIHEILSRLGGIENLLIEMTHGKSTEITQHDKQKGMSKPKEEKK